MITYPFTINPINLMGMFDTITVEYPIEERFWQLEFQTKSLHKCLDRYKITKDGTIYIMVYDLVKKRAKSGRKMSIG